MTRPRRSVNLPLRQGVGASRVFLPSGPWRKTIEFLAEHFSKIPRDEWHSRMASGHVLDAQGHVITPDADYAAQSVLYYYRALAPELPVPFDARIVYQDAHVLVADKPHFLPVVPSGRYLQQTLLVRLKRETGLTELVPLHRIDRDTAGLVMFSVNPETRGAYAALFRERHIMKHYEAVAPWRAELTLPLVHRSRLVEGAEFMRVDEAPGLANTETHIELLARHGTWAHYGLRPVTGHRHQLRVHMNALGIPICNDRIYPTLYPEMAPGEQPNFARPMQLLARSLAFSDPLSGLPRSFESDRQLSMLAAVRPNPVGLPAPLMPS